MTARRLTIGTRGSRLALIQTGTVVDGLKRAHPDLEVEVRPVVTAGDKDRRSPIERLGTDVFVKELEEALLDGRVDIAVHSLKDMPTELPDGLALLATPPREDPADVLVSMAGGLRLLPPGTKIGTGSLRRSAQLAVCRPDVTAVPVRGNIETRLRKVTRGEVDGVMLAAAALVRLGWREWITEYLPVSAFLPACGQGALGIEGRCDDAELAALLAPLNHEETWRCTAAERAFLRAFGAGCRAPIGVLGTMTKGDLKLEAMVLSEDGRDVRRACRHGGAGAAAELGERLAGDLLAEGVHKLLQGNDVA